MKIKVAYGIDTRLWRHGQSADSTDLFDNLLSFITKTFELQRDNFMLQVIVDGLPRPVTTQKDFEIILIAAQEAKKKSVKVQVIQYQRNEEEEGAEKDDVEMDLEDDDDEKKTIQDDDEPSKKGEDEPAAPPTRDEVNAFLSDPEVTALLSDLICNVLIALKDVDFEITFTECLNGILLSESEKYAAITSRAVWSYFLKELLAKSAHKIEQFLVPMIRCNEDIDVEMIKAWIPSLFKMMVQTAYQCGGSGPGQCGGSGWGGWRRRRGGRGRWHRGGKGRFHGRKHRGHKKHHRHHGHGHGHGHRGGWGAFHQGPPPHAHHHGHHGHPEHPPFECPEEAEEMMEPEQDFRFTEELSEIMGMGFEDFQRIKELLNQHDGNKQRVVQKLIAAK